MNADRFESLAQAAIDGEATDAQLEALESAIMEGDDGAADFLHLAEVHFATEVVPDCTAARATGAGVPSVPGGRRLWVIIGGVGARAAAAAIFFGAIFFTVVSQNLNKKKSPPLAADPSSKVVVDEDGEKKALDGLNGVVQAAIPEPSTSLLVLSGSMFLLFRRRREVPAA